MCERQYREQPPRGSPASFSIPQTLSSRFELFISASYLTLPSHLHSLSAHRWDGRCWALTSLLALHPHRRMFSMSSASWPSQAATSATPATRPTSPLPVSTWREGGAPGLAGGEGAPSPLTLPRGPLPRSGGLPFAHAAAGSPTPARAGRCGGRGLLPRRGRPREHPGRLPHEPAQGCPPPPQAPPPR